MNVSEILKELRKERLRLERELAILNTAIDRLDLVETGRQQGQGRPRAVATVVPTQRTSEFLQDEEKKPA